MREAFSTARPSRLRLAGFLTLTAGGTLLAVGALLPWGSVGFPEAVDPTRSVTASVPGIDLWEGLLALAGGVAVLLGMLAMRLVRPNATRRLLAVGIVLVGLSAAALAITVAAGAKERLVQTEGLDAYARAVAERLDLPFDQVRRDIEEVFRADLIVEAGSGPWVVVAGGILAATGGVLGLAWVRRRERSGG